MSQGSNLGEESDFQQPSGKSIQALEAEPPGWKSQLCLPLAVSLWSGLNLIFLKFQFPFLYIKNHYVPLLSVVRIK